MPTGWYYQSFGDEFGPISFRCLVGMVREGDLAEADLVRPDYAMTWQRADDVVGLFYMARRHKSHRESIAAVSTEQIPAFDEGAGTPIDGNRAESEGPEHHEHDVAAIEERRSIDITLAVKDALAHVGLRAVQKGADRLHARTGKLFLRWHSVCRERRILQRVASCGAMAAGAGLALAWVAQWSAAEALRFPGLLEERGLSAFPLVGACGPAEYWFFALDLALLAGIAAYLGMRWIEARLE